MSIIDAQAVRDSEAHMIQDTKIQEAFTGAYAAALERAKRGEARVWTDIARPEGIERGRQRDREAQRRQDLGLDKPRKPREVMAYRDPPADAEALRGMLEDYRYFLGQVKYHPVEKMAALRLPFVVWQAVFSKAKKRVELGAKIENPGAYLLKHAEKEARFCRLEGSW